MSDLETDPREPYGRLVHEQRLALNAELERPFVLGAWEDRAEHQRELDMRIGSAVAAQAVKDAGLANERMQRLVFAFGAHEKTVFDALQDDIERQEYEAEKARFRAALKALGGDEEGGGRG